MRGRLAIVAIGLALASGCTRNAILELELELPPSPAGTRLFAVVDAQSDLGFDDPWPAGPLEGVPLGVACTRADPAPPCDDRVLDPTCSMVVSVVGDAGDVPRPLRVKIRFCEDAGCEAEADLAAPEHRVEIERAFYLGRYTQARACVDEVPAATSPPELIERCDVRCRDGAAAMHCRLDGTHFCE